MPETAPSQSTPASAASVADILARMQANGELQSDLASLLTADAGPAGAGQRPAAAEGHAPPRVPAATPATRGGHHDTEEPDISEYMQRLLKRNSAPSELPAAPQVEPADAGSAKVADEPLTPWNPDEYVPRAVAPEKNWNLSALREVANQSNRCALEQSALNRVQAQVNLFRIAAIAAGAFGLLFCILAGFQLNFPLVLGATSFAAGGWAYWQMKQLQKSCVASAVPSMEPRGEHSDDVPQADNTTPSSPA